MILLCSAWALSKNFEATRIEHQTIIHGRLVSIDLQIILSRITKAALAMKQWTFRSGLLDQLDIPLNIYWVAVCVEEEPRFKICFLLGSV